jgi:hypothetical protein
VEATSFEVEKVATPFAKVAHKDRLFGLNGNDTFSVGGDEGELYGD